MNMKKYKLTISILASNRKDTLPKTLESIKPILDSVSSELIVVDTGCDEDLLEIIRKFTDKIIKFTWCNDFAKARNVGVQKAQGDWFMFIDDDEWFEDVSPIVKFIISGEIDGYKSFGYNVRNYATKDGKDWYETTVKRGVNLCEGMEFVDAVHEHFSLECSPTKYLDCFVHHFGYAFENDEDLVEHSKRNTSILEKLISDEPENERHYIHLIQEYNALEKYEAALECVSKAINILLTKSTINSIELSGLCAEEIFAKIKLKKYEEAILESETILEKEWLSHSSRAIICSYMSSVNMLFGNSLRALQVSLEYMRLYKYLMDNIEIRMNESTLLMGQLYSFDAINRVIYTGLKSSVLLEKVEELRFFVGECCKLKKIEPLDDGSWLEKYVDIMSRGCDKELYATPLLLFFEHPGCATKICNSLLSIKENDTKIFLDTAKAFAESESDNTYIRLIRTIYYGFTGDVRKLIEMNEKIV